MLSDNSSMASYRKGIDWLTVFLYVLLVGFGWANLYAANYNPEVGAQFSFGTEYSKQLVWIILSFGCAGVIMLSDSKIFVEMSWTVYIVSLLLLTVVLFVGKEVYGAKSWLMLGPVAFQPAEFTKIGTALVLARVMSRYDFQFNFKNYVKLFAIILIPVAYILLQNDTGSALVYFVFLLAMFREGMTPHILIIGSLCIAVAIAALLLDATPVIIFITVVAVVAMHILMARQQLPWGAALALGVGAVVGVGLWAVMTYVLNRQIMEDLYFLAGMGAATLTALLLTVSHRLRGLLWLLAYVWIALSTAFATSYIFENVLGDHQRTRINVLFGIEDDPLGAGYNVNQSLIAIGSGGVAGKGYLAGTQTKLDFVPKQTTDFIFCTVGEEWGFLGSAALVIVYVVFFLRILHLAEKQHSAFSRVYGYCVAGVFFFHFTINICMTTGLMPVIGIPLPFFSYGGSSLWGFSVMLFIFLKLDTDRNFLIR